VLGLFYDIRESKDGGFVYFEFYCGWTGYRGFTCGDAYKTFNTRAEAECYAKQRGGVYAYSY
jgi:hypothetical protein